MAYLGIDLGTSGLRLLLVGEDGQPIGSTERCCEVSHPLAGWSEQDPSNWIKALGQAIAEIYKRHPQFAGLRGIGVLGQMHSAMLLDKDGRVVRPCILWNDRRAHVEAAALDATDNVRGLSGNVVFLGLPVHKLEGVRTHEPDIHARTAKVLLPAAYLNY